VLEKAKTFNPPRTPGGKPDMQGYWRSRLAMAFTVEGVAETEPLTRNLITNGFSVEGISETDPLSRNQVQADTVGPGMIVDPPDGKIP
jgi:hypothetical protein